MNEGERRSQRQTKYSSIKLFFMNKLCNILQGEGDTTIQPFHALIMMA
jgi:hypothetical protein